MSKEVGQVPFYYPRCDDDSTPYHYVTYTDVWEGFKGTASAHGLPHYHLAKGLFKKMVWVLISLGALGMLLYQFILITQTFLSYPVIPIVVKQSTRIIEFPAVSVCNTNPIKESELSSSPRLQALVATWEKKSRKKRSVSEAAKSQSQHNDESNDSDKKYDTSYIINNTDILTSNIKGLKSKTHSSKNENYNKEHLHESYGFAHQLKFKNGILPYSYSENKNMKKGNNAQMSNFYQRQKRQTYTSAWCETVSSFGDFCLTAQTVTAANAQQACQALGAYRLVVYNSDTKKDAVVAAIKSKTYTERYYFIGLYYGTSGLEWISGVSFSSSNWKPGETPSTSIPYTKADSAKTSGKSSTHHWWLSAEATSNGQALCEYDLTFIPVTTITQAATTTTAETTMTAATTTTTEATTSTATTTTPEATTTTAATTTTDAKTTTTATTTTEAKTTAASTTTTEATTTTQAATTTTAALTTTKDTTTPDATTTTAAKTITEATTTTASTTTEATTTTQAPTSTTAALTTTKDPTTTEAIITTAATTSNTATTTATTTTQVATTETTTSAVTLEPTTSVGTTTQTVATTSVGTTTQPVAKTTTLPWMSIYEEREPPREDFLQESEVLESLAELPPDVKKKMGYKVDEFLLSCEYDGKQCDTGEFGYFFDAVHGNCYVFNSGWGNDSKPTQARKPGRRNGLTMTFNLGQNEYVRGVSQSAGVIVVVHPRNRMPFPEDEGVFAPPGSLTSVGLNKASVARLGGSYSNCSEGSYNPEINVYEEHFKVNYSVSACYKTCYQRYVIQRCGCSDPQYISTGKAFGDVVVTICNVRNQTQDDCIYGVRLDYIKNILECDCPIPCEETFFRYSMSIAEWPTPNQLNTLLSTYGDRIQSLLNSSSDKSYLTRNFASVEIYFNEFNYQHIYDKPKYPIVLYLADFASILGLYLGLSVLSIAEFLELGSDVIVLGFYKLCKKHINKPAKHERCKSFSDISANRTNSQEELLPRRSSNMENLYSERPTSMISHRRKSIASAKKSVASAAHINVQCNNGWTQTEDNEDNGKVCRFGVVSKPEQNALDKFPTQEYDKPDDGIIKTVLMESTDSMYIPEYIDDYVGSNSSAFNNGYLQPSSNNTYLTDMRKRSDNFLLEDYKATDKFFMLPNMMGNNGQKNNHKGKRKAKKESRV